MSPIEFLEFTQSMNNEYMANQKKKKQEQLTAATPSAPAAAASSANAGGLPQEGQTISLADGDGATAQDESVSAGMEEQMLLQVQHLTQQPAATVHFQQPATTAYYTYPAWFDGVEDWGEDYSYE